MQADPWLDRWLPEIRQRAAASALLELGCGRGDDTEVLLAAGAEVVAIELDPAAAAAARQRVPAATVLCQDLRQPLPQHARGWGVIVASLSLHYFPWAETLTLAERVRQALRPDGLLLCRLNSTEDVHFGARGHPPIEPHYYLVDGAPKRFFDRAAVGALFATGWRWLSCEHRISIKYPQPKALWELALVRSD